MRRPKMEKRLYRDYFNIDPKYYAAVTADLIEQGKVSWKSFFPHETFIKLLETTYRVLSGAATRSIWVEGAYGTGKSHAALTIKSLIDATDEEVESYFKEYKLSRDLCNKYISVKNTGKIITIHRIGSAGINTDFDLIFAVQQSIMAALKEYGIENQGDASMRDAFLEWVEKKANYNYFSDLISEEKYAWNFHGMQADEVMERLKSGTNEQIERMMREVMTVLKESGQYGLFKDTNDMANWIKSIIEENHITAILFVWDEFSEYFLTHPIGLTGFQNLIQISESHPFYFMIVAHESKNLFADADTAKKITDRFEHPVKIELPENMAFHLMKQAMKETSDELLKKKWAEYYNDLNEQLVSVRDVIRTTAKKQSRLGEKTQISDKELQDIVPIHPYAALILKHIATLFNSNQRSMFDFIISNDMTEAKGFKWFINEYGPMDEINLLTIDLLWDFFYGKEQKGLNDDVRGVLDSYRMLQADKLLPDEQRVMKTVLLLQAIALRATGNELLIPNDQNIDLAFAGTDWNKGKAVAIANGLMEKKILLKKLVGGGKYEYCAANLGSSEDIQEYREEAIKETKTQNLIDNGKLIDAVLLPPVIRNRFVIKSTSYDHLLSIIGEQKKGQHPERFYVVVTFSVNEREAEQIHQAIMKNINMPDNDLYFIETLTPMGKDLYDQYIDNIAFSKYNRNKDRNQATYYNEQAETILKEWQDRISNGAFKLYDKENKSGRRIANLAELQDILQSINHKKYYYGLEQYELNDTMYTIYNLREGAECGIKEELSRAFDNKKNKNKSFEKALEGAWKTEHYWEKQEKQSLTIVQIKKKVMEIVEQGFHSEAGRVSVVSILEELEKEPFGFMPSALTSLVMGFVLKEYAKPDFFWSNGSASEVMSFSKMAIMIANAINFRNSPDKKYREEYIVTMSQEMRNFLNQTAAIFKIPSDQCMSLENTRDQMRIKMRELVFPIWSVKNILKNEKLESPIGIIEKIIDDYLGIANTANGNKATESSLAEEIGRIFMENPKAVSDMEKLMTNAYCRSGMLAYIEAYQEGILPGLAAEIGDGGNYLEEIKKKFNANDANWVWNPSTADNKISDVILEYQIILESNKSLQKCTSIRETVSAWNAKTNHIKLPCEVAAKLTGDLGLFLKQLCIMKQSDELLEQNKKKFHELLLNQRESFDTFYKDQVFYFKQDANAFLNDLDEEEIDRLYQGFPSGQFTKSKSDYYRFVQNEVNRFVQSQWKKKLKDLWHEKTKTKDPYRWSEKYRTPILCMFDDSERSVAREMFRIIASSNPSESDAKKAMDYLKRADFYERLEKEEERDDCFLRCIVGSYSVLLQDLTNIREELTNKIYDQPYDWMDNRAVQNCLKGLADKQYKLNGCDRAMEIINTMDTKVLREYLCARIMDDVDFGMQILKGGQGDSEYGL